MSKTSVDFTKIKPVHDAVFKTLFGTEIGKGLLETLLKDILKKDVEIIEYKTRELPKISITEKTKIIDLLVKSKKGLIHIELNSNPSALTSFRNFVYFSGVILLDHQIGEEYKINENYISINLTKELGKTRELIEKYKIQNNKQKNRIKNVEIYEVNLSKAKELYDEGNKREDIKHIAALEMTYQEIEENKGDDKFMESLAVRLGRLNPGGISFVTPEEDDRMMINTMERLARESGLKKGRKSIIKNLLQNGMKVEEVVRLANVDEAEVEKAAKELKH